MQLLDSSSPYQADMLIDYDFDPGVLRPFRERGKTWITINEGTDKEDTLVVNAPATLTKTQWEWLDRTIIDPHRTWTIDVEQFVSKSRNCPFHGWEVMGKAVATIVWGEVKWRER